MKSILKLARIFNGDGHCALLKTGANITLKWGISDSMKLYEWRKRVIEHGAEGERKDVSIVLIDEAGADKSRWEIVRAWPSKYDPPDFSGKGNEVAIELLEIVHEGFTRVK
jgi:phage tail-like protein